ncbi:hypothetical protein F4859DRAFT_492581 [Xylaria cf. heliscus]|nr:hypothetical protein F4859DRAFT_492581 [Xylaria cf. heliscus]
MSDQQAISDSLSKKRARDRRAQRNLRKKRDAHIHGLEQRIADLEKELYCLRQECHGLRCENETLKGQQSLVRRFVNSWNDHVSSVQAPVTTSEGSPAHSPSGTADAVRTPDSDGTSLDGGSSRETKPYSPITLPIIPTNIIPTVPQIPGYVGRKQRSTIKGLTSPRWNITPAHLDTDIILTDVCAICLRLPEVAQNAPEIPRPIELLYGSKTNLLAHAISASLRQWRCRDPERLAVGWLTYRLMKWVSQPSERQFSLLQEFQHPVNEQLCTPHPYFMDYIVWPRLRINLIKTCHIYDPRDVLGMLICCMKVRWPWNETILEPADGGEFVFRAGFRETFMKLEGWGLTKEFLDRFPLLAQDLDITSMLYNFT